MIPRRPDPTRPLSPPSSPPAATAHRWLENGEVLLVDVRETEEFELERIPDAVLLPGSVLEPESFPEIPGLKAVLFCLTGRRSLAIAEQLLRAGFPRYFPFPAGS